MNRYLDLLEACLTGEVNGDPPFDPWHGKVNDQTVTPGAFNLEVRRRGRDWPSTAPTMIGSYRLRQLRAALETVVCENVPGDFIECGVWRGGACIWAAAVLRELREAGGRAGGIARELAAQPRHVLVADSFKGLPRPAAPSDKEHGFPPLAVGLAEVVANFVRYGVMDENIVFVPGWFKDTLPDLKCQLAVLRVDGDLYASTYEALRLYDQLSPGGFCIVDDYRALESCRDATDAFRVDHDITTPIVEIDGTGVYWRKAR